MFISEQIPSLKDTIYQPNALWKSAISLGFPSAIWRLPNSDKIKFLISLQSGVQTKKPDLETLPSCFVIHPFENLPNEEAYVLEGDLIFTILDSGLVEKDRDTLGEEHPLVKKFLDEATDSAGTQKISSPDWQGLVAKNTVDSAREVHYKDMVQSAVTAIREGKLDKIVLSRTKTLRYSDQFDAFQAFQKLCLAYPTAFVSLVNLPERDEMWLGATPETLVAVNAGGVFKTTSLAGTQIADKDLSEEQIARDIRWGQKEIQEQALVSRYIVECFKKIRLREYHERGPNTVQAGNLYHLRTDFEVDTLDVNFSELGSVMLKLLHPTSAVCGTPKAPALDYIRAVEGYDRSFYSGYLGPVQVDQETALFVNLRTLRLSDGVATLFAGAGITGDSDPQREWEETEMKCETLLRVLI